MIMKKIISTLKYWGLCAFVFVGNVFMASAQNPETILQKGKEGLLQGVGYIISIAMILCGVSGAISVTWALIDRKNAQEGANQRLMNVGISLVAAFVLLLVIKLILDQMGVRTAAQR